MDLITHSADQLKLDMVSVGEPRCISADGATCVASELTGRWSRTGMVFSTRNFYASFLIPPL